MKSLLKALTGTVGKTALLLCFSIVNLLFMHYYVFLNHYIEDVIMSYAYGVNLMAVLFDVSILLLLFLLLSWGRLKLSLLLTYVVTLLWSFVNVFYVRFFNQYLALSTISQAGSLTDQAVVNSMMAGFQWTDLYFLLSLAVFLPLYWRIGRMSLDRSLLLMLVGVPFVSLIGTFLVYTTYHFMKSETRGNTALYKSRIKGFYMGRARNSFPNMTRFHVGSVRVACGEVYDLLHTVTLTEAQRAAIATEAADLSQRVTNHAVDPEIKNVVFIVLESFLSAPIDLKVDGKEITPFLNSLKQAEGTYYNGHMWPNITIGESGDGQFIYLTGLLPLRDKLTVGEANHSTLPAFPKLLKAQWGIKYTDIVMPSPPMVWLQEQMNPIYGLDHMYCNRDVLGNVVDYLNDEQIFTLAMKSPFYQHQPFFTLVLSYSTHQPYRDPIDDSLTLTDASLSKTYKNYLIACHYADVWLQKYFDFLKQQGVYDNSLIVITADHHAHLDAFGMGDKVTKELPLFIVNGRVDMEQAWTGAMNQLDVYTTLLDVMGVKSGWHGLGHTVLTKDYQNSVTERTWELSEMIIKGKYFDLDEAK